MVETIAEGAPASLAQRIRHVVGIDPTAVAIEFQGGVVRWGDVAALADEIEHALTTAGVPSHAPVALLLRNRPEMMIALAAAVVWERCIVCVNPLQGESKLAGDLEGIRAQAVIGCAADLDSARIRESVATAGSMALALHAPGAGGVEPVSGLERPGPGPHREIDPGVAVEMLTSGTTGPPKRVELRGLAFEQSLLGASHYEAKRADPDVLKTGFALLMAPLVHIGGMFHGVKALVDGRSVCLIERFSVEAWRDAVRRHRPKVAALVPSAMKMVFDAGVPGEELSSLRAVTTGTAPLSPELQEAFETRYGIPVLVTYGATEFAGAVAGWTIRDHREFAAAKRGAVGRAHGGCELRVVDPDGGEVLGPDEPGLLEVRSGQSADQGWVRTADLARLDADGFLWIEGRADGAINRGGFKVDPAGVARVLERHPAIREAAVVGIPDERLGEVPVAVYELAEGAEPPSVEELLAFSREHLTRYYVPVSFHAVDAIPRTPSLKPSMPAIRALLADAPA